MLQTQLLITSVRKHGPCPAYLRGTILRPVFVFMHMSVILFLCLHLHHLCTQVAPQSKHRGCGSGWLPRSRLHPWSTPAESGAHIARLLASVQLFFFLDTWGRMSCCLGWIHRAINQLLPCGAGTHSSASQLVGEELLPRSLADTVSTFISIFYY